MDLRGQKINRQKLGDCLIQYKDFEGFCTENGFTYKEGIEELDRIIESKKKWFH